MAPPATPSLCRFKSFSDRLPGGRGVAGAGFSGLEGSLWERLPLIVGDMLLNPPKNTPSSATVTGHPHESRKLQGRHLPLKILRHQPLKITHETRSAVVA